MRSASQLGFHPLGVETKARRRQRISPAAVIYPLLAAALVVGALLGYIRLRSNTQRIAQIMATRRMEMAKNSKEIVNLRVLYEQYTSGDHILGAVRRYRMGLHPPFPGQVRRMSWPLVAENNKKSRSLHPDDSDPMFARNW